jgi:hypothetical protein
VKVTDNLAEVPVFGHEYDLEREFYIIHLGQAMDDVFLEVIA